MEGKFTSMTIGANKILNRLPQFANEQIKLKQNQTVSDIVQAIKKTHKQFANDYDRIGPYFLGKNIEKTCKNIFDFLRQNTRYFIESENKQSVKSPAAILKTKNIDCKNYALFTAGILDALDRAGLQNIEYCYRFVSSKVFDTNPTHVFICAYDENENEIWIDPIPEVLFFDHKLNFFHPIDKYFKAMPLYQISGVENQKPLGQVGFVLPVGLDEIQNITSVITNLFGNRPNPNDWAGWAELDRKIGAPLGTNARSFVIKDGDSVSNEALNIVRWIENKGLQTVLGYDPWHKREITMQDISSKLNRGGYGNEAQLLLQQSNSILDRITPVPGNASSFPTSGGAPFITNMPGQQRAGMSTPVLLGLAAVAAYFLFSKK